MAHTPGPWEVVHCVDGAFLISGTSDGDHITIATRDAIPRRHFEFAANARLIAAAPDLLVALKGLRALILGECGASAYEGVDGERADAAIAKAEGA